MPLLCLILSYDSSVPGFAFPHTHISKLTGSGTSAEITRSVSMSDFHSNRTTPSLYSMETSDMSSRETSPGYSTGTSPGYSTESSEEELHTPDPTADKDIAFLFFRNGLHDQPWAKRLHCLLRASSVHTLNLLIAKSQV